MFIPGKSPPRHIYETLYSISEHTRVYVLAESPIGDSAYFHKLVTSFMTVRVDIGINSGLFYITFTCYKWIPLFEITHSYDVVYKWFDYLKSKGHYICRYVIMPNHVHAIIGFKKHHRLCIQSLEMENGLTLMK